MEIDYFLLLLAQRVIIIYTGRAQVNVNEIINRRQSSYYVVILS